MPQAQRSKSEREAIVQRLIEEAVRRGYTPQEIVALLTIADIESSFNPKEVGDGGQSFGLFQINVRRFPKYGVTMQDAHKLFDLNYLLPRVFNDFNELRERIRRYRPEWLQVPSEKQEARQLAELLANMVAAYSTWWQAPSLIDQFLQGDTSVLSRVYPKVSPERRRQAFQNAFNLYRQHFPQVVQKLKGEENKKLTAVATDLASRLFPHLKATPPVAGKVEAPAPVLMPITSLVQSFPQVFHNYRMFNTIVQELQRRRLPVPSYQYQKLPGIEPKDEIQKILSHLLSLDPSLRQSWTQLTPSGRNVLWSVLEKAAREIVRTSDPKQHQDIIRRTLLTLSKIPELRTRPPGTLRAAGEVVKGLGLGLLKDVGAIVFSAWASVGDTSDLVDFRGKKMRLYLAAPLSLQETLRHLLPQSMHSVELPAALRVLRGTVPVGYLATPRLILDILVGGLVDLVGGGMWAVGWLGDKLAGLFGADPRLQQRALAFQQRYARQLTSEAVQLSLNPDFRKRHYNNALAFALSVMPEEVGRNLRLSDAAWREYAIAFLSSVVLDALKHDPLLSQRIPEVLRESLLNRAPTLGFLASLPMAMGAAGALTRGVSAAAKAANLSAKAQSILTNVMRGALYTAIGVPEEVVAPKLTAHLTNLLAREGLEAAQKVVKGENLSFLQKIAHAITRPPTSLVEGKVIAEEVGKVTEFPRPEALVQVYRRAGTAAEIINDTLRGAVTGAIFLSPQYGTQRDYGAGMLAGALLHIPFRFGSWLSREFWRWARHRQPFRRPMEAMSSEWRVPEEVALEVWSSFVRHAEELFGVPVEPKTLEEVIEQRDFFSQVLPQLFRDEFTARVLQQLVEVVERPFAPPRPIEGSLPEDVHQRGFSYRAMMSLKTLTDQLLPRLKDQLPENLKKKLADGEQDLSPQEVRQLQRFIQTAMVSVYGRERIPMEFQPFLKAASEVLTSRLLVEEFGRDDAVTMGVVTNTSRRLMETLQDLQKRGVPAIEAWERASETTRARAGLPERPALPPAPIEVLTNPALREFHSLTVEEAKRAVTALIVGLTGDRKVASDLRQLVNRIERFKGSLTTQEVAEAALLVQMGKSVRTKASFVVSGLRRLNLLSEEAAQAMNEALNDAYRKFLQGIQQATTMESAQNALARYLLEVEDIAATHLSPLAEAVRGTPRRLFFEPAKRRRFTEVAPDEELVAQWQERLFLEGVTPVTGERSLTFSAPQTPVRRSYWTPLTRNRLSQADSIVASLMFPVYQNFSSLLHHLGQVKVDASRSHYVVYLGVAGKAVDDVVEMGQRWGWTPFVYELVNTKGQGRVYAVVLAKAGEDIPAEVVEKVSDGIARMLVGDTAPDDALDNSQFVIDHAVTHMFNQAPQAVALSVLHDILRLRPEDVEDYLRMRMMITPVGRVLTDFFVRYPVHNEEKSIVMGLSPEVRQELALLPSYQFAQRVNSLSRRKVITADEAKAIFDDLAEIDKQLNRFIPDYEVLRVIPIAVKVALRDYFGKPEGALSLIGLPFHLTDHLVTTSYNVLRMVGMLRRGDPTSAARLLETHVVDEGGNRLLRLLVMEQLNTPVNVVRAPEGFHVPYIVGVRPEVLQKFMEQVLLPAMLQRSLFPQSLPFSPFLAFVSFLMENYFDQMRPSDRRLLLHLIEARHLVPFQKDVVEILSRAREEGDIVPLMLPPLRQLLPEERVRQLEQSIERLEKTAPQAADFLRFVFQLPIGFVRTVLSGGFYEEKTHPVVYVSYRMSGLAHDADVVLFHEGVHAYTDELHRRRFNKPVFDELEDLMRTFQLDVGKELINPVNLLAVLGDLPSPSLAFVLGQQAMAVRSKWRHLSAVFTTDYLHATGSERISISHFNFFVLPYLMARVGLPYLVEGVKEGRVPDDPAGLKAAMFALGYLSNIFSVDGQSLAMRASEVVTNLERVSHQWALLRDTLATQVTPEALEQLGQVFQNFEGIVQTLRSWWVGGGDKEVLLPAAQNPQALFLLSPMASQFGEAWMRVRHALEGFLSSLPPEQQAILRQHLPIEAVQEAVDKTMAHMGEVREWILTKPSEILDKLPHPNGRALRDFAVLPEQLNVPLLNKVIGFNDVKAENRVAIQDYLSELPTTAVEVLFLRTRHPSIAPLALLNQQLVFPLVEKALSLSSERLRGVRGEVAGANVEADRLMALHETYRTLFQTLQEVGRTESLHVMHQIGKDVNAIAKAAEPKPAQMEVIRQALQEALGLPLPLVANHLDAFLRERGVLLREERGRVREILERVLAPSYRPDQNPVTRAILDDPYLTAFAFHSSWSLLDLISRSSLFIGGQFPQIFETVVFPLLMEGMEVVSRTYSFYLAPLLNRPGVSALVPFWKDVLERLLSQGQLAELQRVFGEQGLDIHTQLQAIEEAAQTVLPAIVDAVYDRLSLHLQSLGVPSSLVDEWKPQLMQALHHDITALLTGKLPIHFMNLPTLMSHLLQRNPFLSWQQGRLVIKNIPEILYHSPSSILDFTGTPKVGRYANTYRVMLGQMMDVMEAARRGSPLAKSPQVQALMQWWREFTNSLLDPERVDRLLEAFPVEWLTVFSPLSKQVLAHELVERIQRSLDPRQTPPTLPGMPEEGVKAQKRVALPRGRDFPELWSALVLHEKLEKTFRGSPQYKRLRQVQLGLFRQIYQQLFRHMYEQLLPALSLQQALQHLPWNKWRESIKVSQALQSNPHLYPLMRTMGSWIEDQINSLRSTYNLSIPFIYKLMDTAIERTLERAVGRKVAELVSVLHEQLREHPEELRQRLQDLQHQVTQPMLREVKEAWIAEGLEGLRRWQFIYEPTQTPLRFTDAELSELKTAVETLPMQVTQELSRLQEKAQFYKEQPSFKLLRNLREGQVITREVIERVGGEEEIVTQKVLRTGDGVIYTDPAPLVDKFLDEFGEDLQANWSQFEPLLRRRYNETVLARLRRALGLEEEGEIDRGNFQDILLDEPQLLVDLASLMTPLMTDRLAGRVVSEVGLKHTSQDLAAAMAKQWLTRKKGATTTQLLGLVALGAALYAAARHIPGLDVALNNFWEFLMQTPITHPVLWAGGLAMAGTAILRALKGERLLLPFANALQQAAQHLHFNRAPATDLVREMHRQLLALGDEKRAAMLSALVNDLLTDVPPDFVSERFIEEVNTKVRQRAQTPAGQPAPPPLVAPEGWSPPLRRQEREQIATNLARHIAVTSVALQHAHLYDMLMNLTRQTAQARVLTEGMINAVQAIKAGRHADVQDFINDMAALKLLQVLKRHKDWSRIKDTPIRQLMRVFVSTRQNTPQGVQRVTVTPSEVEIVVRQGGQAVRRNFGDLTVAEAWDLLLAPYTNNPATLMSVFQHPKAYDEALDLRRGAIRERVVNSLRRLASPQTQRAAALAERLSQNFLRLRAVFTNPDITAAFHTTPLLHPFYILNLMEAKTMLESDEVRQLLGEFGDEAFRFVEEYLRVLKSSDLESYRLAEQMQARAERVVKEFIQTVLGVQDQRKLVKAVQQLMDKMNGLYRYFMATASRRLEVAGLPRPMATMLRATIAHPEQAVASAWSRALQEHFNKSVLQATLAFSIPEFLRRSPYINLYEQLLQQRGQARELKPLGMWMTLGYRLEKVAKDIAVAEKVPQEEVLGALNTVAYYLYTAERSGVHSFEEALERVEHPQVKEALRRHRQDWESVVAHLAVLAHYLTDLNSHRAWMGEWLFKGSPTTQLVEKAYFPQSAEAQNVPIDLFGTHLGALAELLFTGANDRVLVTRWGLGRRFFQQERTGRALPKKEQFWNILTNFYRSIVHYEALLPYAGVLHALSVLAPSWLAPTIARELHLAVGSALMRRGMDNPWTIFAEQLSRRAESWEALVNYSKSATAFQLSTTGGNVAAQALQTVQTTALALNISSVLRQLTTFADASSRIVNDFQAPELAMLPILNFPRAMQLMLGHLDEQNMTALERFLLLHMPALKSRHLQSERSVLLSGLAMLNDLLKDSKASRHLQVLLDPRRPLRERIQAFHQIWQYTEKHATLGTRATEFGLAALQFLDEAMVLSTALSGAEAYLLSAMSKGIPITEEVVRNAVRYGQGLAEDVQASPAHSFAPLFFQSPWIAGTVLGPALRQFVNISFATAETFAHLLGKTLTSPFRLFTAKNAQEARRAMEDLVGAMAGIIVYEMCRLLLNSVTASLTGRQIEEVPVGYPPDEDSVTWDNIVADLAAASTPRAFHRLANLAVSGMMGGTQGLTEMASSLETPPAARAVALTALGIQRTAQVLQTYRELQQVPRHADQSVTERLLAALEVSSRLGGPENRVVWIADTLSALLPLTAFFPKWARYAQAVPTGQIIRSLRAWSSEREGMPAVTQVAMPSPAGQMLQVAAGVPFLFGVSSPIIGVSQLAGPVTNIARQRTSAPEKALALMKQVGRMPVHMSFVAVMEFLRRANNPANLKAAALLVHPTVWRREDTRLSRAIREFMEVGQLAGSEVYRFIKERPNDFLAMAFLFSPDQVAKMAGEEGRKWFVEGQFNAQKFFVEAEPFFRDNPNFLRYLTQVLTVATEKNGLNYWRAKQAWLVTKQRYSQALSKVRKKEALK